MPKISALTLAVTTTGEDLVPVVQSGVTKKAALNTLPVSTPVVNALALKASLSSPAFTGTPTTPTAPTATNTTQIASTAFVQQELIAGQAIARSLIVPVRNQSGATLAAGTVVYINGATGNLPTIAKALASADATSAQTIGLVQESIANNGSGNVVIRGNVGGLNTSALTEGQQLYLSPTVAGTYTTTKQFAPNHLVYVGIVTRAHPTLGAIEVAIQNGYEMDELHNVSAQSPSNGDTLRYNSATALWEKSALGTLATQNGTFSGTSSGTNTGDQTALTVPNTPAGNIAATTVQAAINELDSEKTTAAAALAAADAADLAATAALIEREGLRFDGTAGAVIGGGGIPAVGTGDFTAISAFRTLTSAYNFDAYPFHSTNTGGYRFLFRNGTGFIWLAQGGSIYSIAYSPDLVPSTTYMVAHVRQSGISYVYVNGVLAGSVADTSNYTAACDYLSPNVAGSSISLISHAQYYNYALTAAEIAALTRRGLVTLPEQKGGGEFLTGDSSTFTSGVGSWTSFNGGTVGASGGVLNVSGGTNAGAQVPVAFKQGGRYRFRFTVSNYVQTTGVSVRLESAAFSSAIVYFTANGALDVTLTAASDGTSFYTANTSGSVSFSLDNFTVTRLGTLFEQDSGQRNAGYLVRDTSGNNADLILPASGVSVIDPAMRGMIRFTTTTSGNQQIGGSQVIIPTNARISSWVINSSGTPNVTLGNVSAGAQYRASAAVAVGDNQITLLTPFTSTGNLWVNSSTTATLKHTIQWEYIQ